ncbi:hypothetical protein [Delftia tsuruhatensis]|uniref:hypothetical protein n=1 Tax=Delftia tsuruhatensis TaxID=180282 RepID=UPI000AC58700|nr:hypothetical protein [Delftia tsuruhatensis]
MFVEDRSFAEGCHLTGQADDGNRCNADTHNPQNSITKWVDIRPEVGRSTKPVDQS